MEKKQQASLLNFFSKSPKVTPKGKAESKIGKDKTSPKTSDNDNNNDGKYATKNNNRSPNENGSSSAKSNGCSPELKKKPAATSSSVASSSSSGHVPGDVVWARLEGYPYWPSMVCVDPTSKAQFSRLGMIHVQFFDESSSHAWVKKEAVAQFKNVGQVG